MGKLEHGNRYRYLQLCDEKKNKARAVDEIHKKTHPISRGSTAATNVPLRLSTIMNSLMYLAWTAGSCATPCGSIAVMEARPVAATISSKKIPSVVEDGGGSNQPHSRPRSQDTRCPGIYNLHLARRRRRPGRHPPAEKRPCLRSKGHRVCPPAVPVPPLRIRKPSPSGGTTEPASCLPATKFSSGPSSPSLLRAQDEPRRCACANGGKIPECELQPNHVCLAGQSRPGSMLLSSGQDASSSCGRAQGSGLNPRTTLFDPQTRYEIGSGSGGRASSATENRQSVFSR
jgi:hypothetical protein